MDASISSQMISSVREVYEELKRYAGPQQHLLEWLEQNKHIFTKPSLEEQDKVREILAIPEFQQLVDNKQRMKGHPVADPFVIAKAWASKGAVVTNEIFAPGKNKPRIPDVCQHFQILCMGPEEFMRRESWRF